MFSVLFQIHGIISMSLKSTEITDEIENYINTFFATENDFQKKLKQSAKIKNFPQIVISPQQAAFLQFLIKAVNARYILEIGSLYGYSAISMAYFLPNNGKLISLEKDKELSKYLKFNIKKAGLSDIIEVHNVEALGFLKAYKPEFAFDLVFIDADKQQYPDYLRFGTKLLRKGGIIAADNALAFGDIAKRHITGRKDEVMYVRKFNKILSDPSRYKSCLLPIGDGLAMGIKL